MQISELNIYPVKSLHGVGLTRARLTPRGLAYDRHWMVVDAAQRFVTQREIPPMARIAVRLTDDALILEHADHAPLTIELTRSDQPRLAVTIFQDECEALDEGEEAAAWLSAILGQQGLRLVRFAEDRRRDVEPDWLRGEQAHTAFPDGYPFLVTAEGSLAGLNESLAKKGLDAVPMDRFRPNIVVDSDAPFAERDWDELAADGDGWRIGIRKPCKRCKVITVDQDNGTTPLIKEPLKTLAEMATQPGMKGAFFGQNAILLDGDGQTVAVGDRVTASPR
ncbi:MOSC domain-containing protein [Halofilum ochraceum]|uniref:MOSC domain-containing protein n=1 Tax=Halofilum ochraceum TaxID=1611323 RepID=UPI0008D946AB|nr:MOSC N-terminal beta barrel domain-containing protein [Halofilum ochraceum]